MTIVKSLPLDAVELDVELQPREDIDRDLIASYAEAMMAGADFPPVVVFRNGSAQHLLADGWHRYYAHQVLERAEIAAEVREGDREAALRHSLQANATHGRQRSELTIKRAYAKAVQAGLVDAADTNAVRDLLSIGQRTAEDLTREPRKVRKAAMRSLALALAAKGVSQRKIAQRLGVAQQTIQRWLTHPRTDAETGHPDPLPSEAELVGEYWAAHPLTSWPDIVRRFGLEMQEQESLVG